ncbi:DUF3307 domain-containing protein [bacterium]|nr:DUF3307 domain-containing protein [bacterium]
MDLFWRFLLAHFIADFPLQNRAIRNIKHKWYGVLLHSLIFGILCIFAIVNFGAGDFTWPYFYIPKIWLVIGILTVSHFIIDRIKYLIAARIGKETLYLFLADQVIHIGLIYLLVTWMGIIFPSRTYFRLLSLAVLAIWGLPIIIFLIKAQIKEGGTEPIAQIKEEWQRVAFFERSLLFLGLVLGTLRAYFFFVFVAIAIIIRILLKLNKDNVKIPVWEWISTVFIAAIAIILEIY